MQLLPITAITAAVFAILMVALSAQTSLGRARVKSTFGDGGDETLRRRIRAHGNFAEYAPMALILLGLAEGLGAARGTVLGLAIAFCFARLVHAAGMLYSSRATLRAVAMFVQHAAFVYAAVLLLQRILSAGHAIE
jgi:uncharacterized membrane protein YecN with MAPEG domain